MYTVSVDGSDSSYAAHKGSPAEGETQHPTSTGTADP